MNSTRKLWVGLAALLIASFAVLLWVGSEIHRQSPPMPEQVVGPKGEVIFTRKDIETETRRALEQIRKEVADLTVIATEKVTRKSLDEGDHQRLIEEALDEVDFTALAGEPS